MYLTMANIETRQNCSMKDIINLFIEYDENVKINSLTVKNTFESAKTLKKNGFNKNFQRNTIKCTYCNRIGHKTEECRIKFWNENKNKTASSSKISSNVQLFSPSTSTTSSSSSTTTMTTQQPQISTIGHPNHPMMVAAAAAAAAAAHSQLPSSATGATTASSPQTALPSDYQHAAAFYPWFLRANPFAGRFPGKFFSLTFRDV